MTSNSQKNVPVGVPQDSQKSVSEDSQTGLDPQEPVTAGDVVLGAEAIQNQAGQKKLEKELNGPKGLEPTRYGDWESKGRCYDF